MENIKGICPNIVVIAVINIGLNLVGLAFNTASTALYPSLSLSILIYSMRTIPLFTTIPTSTSAPITAITLILSPVKNKSTHAPLNANGIVNIIINGFTSDSN